MYIDVIITKPLSDDADVWLVWTVISWCKGNITGS